MKSPYRRQPQTPSEQDLSLALKDFFPRHSYILLKNVVLPAVVSGRETTRTADAMAIGLLQSRDLSIHGFEMKSKRQDWLNELENQEKAEGSAQYCDLWSAVAPEGVIEEPEVPENWGLYVLTGGKLKHVKYGKRLSPKEPDRKVMASIVYNILNQMHLETPEDRLEDEYKKGYALGIEEGKAGIDQVCVHLEKRLLQKTATLDSMSKSLEAVAKYLHNPGMMQTIVEVAENISSWRSVDSQRILEAVRFLSHGAMGGAVPGLTKMKEEADKVSGKISSLIETITTLSKIEIPPP